MPHMEHGLPTRPDHMSSPPVCNKNTMTGATYGAGTPTRPKHMSSPPVYNQNNMTGATYGEGTAYSFEAHEFTTGFEWGSCRSLVFCIVF